MLKTAARFNIFVY